MTFSTKNTVHFGNIRLFSVKGQDRSQLPLVEKAVAECLKEDVWAIPSVMLPDEGKVIDVFDGGKKSDFNIPDTLKDIHGPVTVVISGDDAYKLWQDTIGMPIPEELRDLSQQEYDVVYNRDPKKYEDLLEYIRKAEARFGLRGLTEKVWTYVRHAQEQETKIIREEFTPAAGQILTPPF